MDTGSEKLPGLVVQAVMSLRKHNIRSIDDVKSSIARLKELKSAHLQSNTQKQRRVITDPAQLVRQKAKNSAPLWVAGIFLVAGLGLSTGGVFLAQGRTG